jgi:hypothetical protein
MDLRNQVDILMNSTNKNAAILNRIKDSMDSVMKLDFPDINSYSKK